MPNLTKEQLSTMLDVDDMDAVEFTDDGKTWRVSFAKDDRKENVGLLVECIDDNSVMEWPWDTVWKMRRILAAMTGNAPASDPKKD